MPRSKCRVRWASRRRWPGACATANRDMTSAPAPAWGLSACPSASVAPFWASSARQQRDVVPRSTARANSGKSERVVVPLKKVLSSDLARLAVGSSRETSVIPSGTRCRQASRQPSAKSFAERQRISAGRGGGGAFKNRTRQRPQRPRPAHRGKGGMRPDSQMACESVCPGVAERGMSKAWPRASWSGDACMRTSMLHTCPKLGTMSSDEWSGIWLSWFCIFFRLGLCVRRLCPFFFCV